jgi:hypothetical protein
VQAGGKPPPSLAVLAPSAAQHNAAILPAMNLRAEPSVMSGAPGLLQAALIAGER